MILALHKLRLILLGAILSALFGGVAAAQQEGATFRFDELDPRDFEYNDEYFINVLNYTQRITHRWKYEDAALGYSITAGSLRNDELYLDQRAKVRLPFSNFLTAEYRYVEWEDYDSRFQRHEVEALVRLFREDFSLPLLETTGRTPSADGLFIGGQGVLDADKEFADLGFVAGYRNRVFGLRFDALTPDFFYNQKNRERAEYTSDPYTLRATGWLNLLGGDLQLEAWYNHELPLRLVLPERNGGTVFRYRQVRAGFKARWTPRYDLRFDLRIRAERTRKRRRAQDPDPIPEEAPLSYRLNREAFRLNVQSEFDVAPLWGETASRAQDTWVFSLQVHLLNELTRRPRTPLERDTLRRQETYAEVAYLLSIPSPGPDYRFAIRVSGLAGFLSWRDVRPGIQKHRVTEKLLAKLAAGFEVGFRDDRGSAFFQMTWRADDQSFGGGNVQVQMSF